MSDRNETLRALSQKEEAARAKLEKDSLDIKLVRIDELDTYFPTST